MDHSDSFHARAWRRGVWGGVVRCGGGVAAFAAMLLRPRITLMLAPIGLAVGLSDHIFTAFERWLTRLVVGGPRR